MVIPVVMYRFNIINWTTSKLKDGHKIKKIFTMNRMHHPKADVEWIFLLRLKKGRRMLQLENAYKVATIGFNTYLEHITEKY